MKKLLKGVYWYRPPEVTIVGIGMLSTYQTTDNIFGFVQGLKKNNALAEKCLPERCFKAIGLIRWKALKGRSPSTENVLEKFMALLLADLQSALGQKLRIEQLIQIFVGKDQVVG